MDVLSLFFSTKCRTRRNVASTKSRMRPIVVSAKWFSTNCRAPGFYITFNENIIVSNSLVPDQSGRFDGHDLDPKCLKRTSGTFHLIILLIDALAVHRS